MKATAHQCFVFVSYSRTDVSFAGGLSLALGTQGIACWLDADQLSPGSDWAEAIDAALEQCDAVVLVASGESLASPHCRREWRRVLAAGKPVILAGIEKIVVPEELREQPAVDMRGRGGIPWNQLAAAIHGGGPQARQSLGRLRVPRPIQIAALMLALLFAFQAVVFFETVSYLRPSLESGRPAVAAIVTSHLAILVGWIAFTTRWAWRFVNRRGGLPGLMVMITVPFLWSIQSIFVTTPVGELGIFVSMGFFGISYLALDKGLDLWLPMRRRNRASDATRGGRVLAEAGGNVGRVALVPGGCLKYEIRCAAQDAHIARRVELAMTRWGHQQIPLNADGADVRLLLLSNATSVTFAPLSEIARQPTVCVVLSAIDVGDDRRAFHRHQWVDHRGRGDRTLDLLASWLREPTPAASAALVGDPTELNGISLPVGPVVLVGALTLLAGLFLFGTLTPILETSYKHHGGQPTWSVVAGFAIALLAAASAATLRARAVTCATFVALYLVTIGLVCAFAAAHHADLGAYVTLAVGVGYLLFMTSLSLRDWLLACPLRWRNYPTVAPQPVSRFVARQIAVILAAAAAASIISASADSVNWR